MAMPTQTHVLPPSITLRTSKKNGRDKPKILLKAGKTDKLVKDYLEFYEEFKNL